MSKVSVIIPTYNSARYLPEAIESVIGQTYQDFEIIVVDDGSTDNTQEVVENALQGYSNKILYFYQENQGHAITRNVGIRHSVGEYIAFLDADDKWAPNKLERQMTYLDGHPTVGHVHCARIRVDKDGDLLPTPRVSIQFLSGNIFYHLLLRKAHICTSSVVCRKECLNNVGYFDEHFPDKIGGEDRDLWLRIAKKYPIGYIDEPLVYYRYFTNSLSKTRGRESIIKGRYYVINKNLNEEKNRFRKTFIKMQAYSSVHQELIYSALAENNFFDALTECVKAICRFPFQVKIYFKLLNISFSILQRRFRFKHA